MKEPKGKSFPEQLFEAASQQTDAMPSRREARTFLGGLIGLMFPVTEGLNPDLDCIESRCRSLQELLERILQPLMGRQQAADAAGLFFGQMPQIYRELVEDAAMFSDSDPASVSPQEVILCYPGFYAIMVYRISNALYRLGVPVLPRIMSEYAHSKTGIDIHPGASIGRRLYIDHGTGIVIGQTCIIGDNVKIYQGVTLGAMFVDGRMRGERRHPVIGDNVIIYAGSTILGGDTVVGRDSVIGGNVWLTESVPPGSRVYHRPEIVIKGER